MIQADAIEAIAQGQHSLDFMSLNHGGQHIAHRGNRLPRGLRDAAHGDR